MGLHCSEGDIRTRVGLFVSAAILAQIEDGEKLLIATVAADGYEGLITRWSAQLEADIGYPIATSTETITVDGFGTNEIILDKKYTPILSIGSVSYTNAGGSITSYGFHASSGIIYLRYAPEANVIPLNTWGTGRLEQPVWPQGRDNITITDLAYGYASTPAELRKATADRVAAEILRQDAGSRDQGLTTKQLGDRSESYGKGRWSEEIAAYVESYNLAVREYTSEVQVG